MITQSCNWTARNLRTQRAVTWLTSTTDIVVWITHLNALLGNSVLSLFRLRSSNPFPSCSPKEHYTTSFMNTTFVTLSNRNYFLPHSQTMSTKQIKNRNNFLNLFLPSIFSQGASSNNNETLIKLCLIRYLCGYFPEGSNQLSPNGTKMPSKNNKIGTTSRPSICGIAYKTIKFCLRR